MSGFLDDTLSTPFIFVPHGDPEPLEWMAAHPGWVKFPATMVPRASPDQQARGSAPEPPRQPGRRFPGGSPCDVPAEMRRPGEGLHADPNAPAAAASFSDFVATYNEVSRLIGAPLLTPPTPSEPADFWSGAWHAASELFGIPPARAQSMDEEASRRGGPGSADPEPAGRCGCCGSARQ